VPDELDQHADVAEARRNLTEHLAQAQKLHILFAEDSQALKLLGKNGFALSEIKLAYEMLEQYLAISDAFVENMRGRFEARLEFLRRSEPKVDGKPGREELAPGHTLFWLEFSRLTAVLRRIARRSEL
jgi:hypothetical protein